MLVRRKIEVVEAEQWFPKSDKRHKAIAGVFDEVEEYVAPDGSHWPAYAVMIGRNNREVIEAGDWVLTSESKEQFVCKSWQFNRMYEEAS